MRFIIKILITVKFLKNIHVTHIINNYTKKKSLKNKKISKKYSINII